MNSAPALPTRSPRRAEKKRTKRRPRSGIPTIIAEMADEEWIKTLADGRKVKFFYQELVEDGAFITAKIEGNEVFYSIILNKVGNPLSREDAEGYFESELSKK